jgi:NADH-quinone oxidoreductase subunit H
MVWGIVIATLVKLVIILGFAITLSALLTWMERRQSAMMQDRLGPQRANIGPFTLWGLLHPLADAIKLLVKEDHIPPRGNKVIFKLAPLLALLPVLMVFAVIPFGPPVCWGRLSATFANVVQQCTAASSTDGAGTATGVLHHLQVARIDIGMLFIFAIASISVYGAALAGWSSNNNYGLLGGLRASAQMLSYEITMGMAVMGLFLVYGSLEPGALVHKQTDFWDWGIFRQPLAFILFFFAAIAETKRAPFDLPEGESEIVGYFVEYSGVRFMSFYLGEFLEIAFVGAMISTLFFGGWQLPGLYDNGLYFSAKAAASGAAPWWEMPHWLVTAFRTGGFFFKVLVLCFIQLAIRWSVPRMRYDQLMKLGWKGMLPASIINVVATAGVIYLLQLWRN